jgi:hypothetical protein
MIIVKIELLSAIDNSISEIGRMYITNDGTGTSESGNYHCKIMRRGETSQSGGIWKLGHVNNHHRKSLSIWTLVVKALGACMGGKAI